MPETVPGKALLVIVTGTGFAKDAVIHVPPTIRTEELEQISRFLTKRLYGTRMDSVADMITSELESEMADSAGITFFQQEVEQAVVDEPWVEVFHAVLPDAMHQVVVYVIDL